MIMYDKDMERVMQAKKREVIRELEDYKNKILAELSGVDKLTLTRLRQILNNYDSIQHDISESTDMMNAATTALNEKITAVETLLSDLNGFEKAKIVYADKFVTPDGNIDAALKYVSTLTDERIILKLGAGVYTFSEQFKPSKCVVIEGCGSSQTTLKYTGSVSPAVIFTDIDGAGFRGIGLYGGNVNVRVDGVEIKCTSKNQIGGHVFEDVWLRYFKTGLRIYGNVFTIRATYLRIYECSEYGIYNTGTDNQFIYICTQGCNMGNYYGGANNAYGMIYSIFDGRLGEYSNFFTGNRNHIAQMTTQDSYKSLIFDGFDGHFTGQFDALYCADGEESGLPEYFVEIRNKSVVNGELAISSYRTETIPNYTVYVDEFSVFNGKMPHAIFIPPYILGVVNDTVSNGAETINTNDNVIIGLGYSYNVVTTGDYQAITVSPVSGYTDSIRRNGIKPDTDSTWIFTGLVKKSADSDATAIKVFNDSGDGEAYASKEVLKLTDEFTPFFVAVHRSGENNVSLMVEGLTTGTVTFDQVRAFNVTGLASKRFFSIPSCYSVFN